MRVAMLLPVVLVISLATARRLDKATRAQNKVVLLPGSCWDSWRWRRSTASTWFRSRFGVALTEVSRWLLVISVAALGMKTSARDIMSVGGTAIGLIAAETIFLALVVLGWILTGH